MKSIALLIAFASLSIAQTAQFPGVVATPSQLKVDINGVIKGVPTSCSGHSTGTLWNNSGTAAFCP